MKNDPCLNLVTRHVNHAGHNFINVIAHRKVNDPKIAVFMVGLDWPLLSECPNRIVASIDDAGSVWVEAVQKVEPEAGCFCVEDRP